MAISSDNKLIAKNTAYLYARLIISLFIRLYTSRAILSILGVTDYGIYNVVGGFVAMLSLFTITLTNSSSRFITYSVGKGNPQILRDTFSTIHTVLILLGLTIFVVGEFFGFVFMDGLLNIPLERLSAAHVVFHCSLLSFCLRVISIPYSADIIAHEKINFYAIVELGDTIFKLVIVYLLLLSPYDKLSTYAVMMVFSSLVVRFIYGMYCSKHFLEAKFSFHIDKQLFRNIFSYSFWITIGASSSILKEQGVNVVINIFYGVTMNAARGVAMQVYSVINSFASNIGTAINPQITKSFAKGDFQRSVNLTILLTKAQGALLLIFILPVAFEVDYILHLWLGEVPYYANTFTLWVLILCFARTVEKAHGPIFLANGNVKALEMIGGGVMLLNLPLCYLFLKFGASPVSTMIIGTVIEVVVTVIALYFLKKLIDFPVKKYVKESIIPLILVVLLSTPIPLLIKFSMHQGILRLMCVLIVSSFLVIVTSYTVLLNKKERNLVREVVIKKITSHANKKN